MIESNPFLLKLLDNRYRFFQHLAFICLIFFFWFLFSFTSAGPYANYFKVFLYSSTFVLIAYFNIYVLFQKLLLRGKIGLYVLCSLLTFVSGYVVQAFIHFRSWEKFFKDFTPSPSLVADILINAITCCMFIGIGLSVKMIKLWILSEKRIVNLEKESLRAKLDGLRSKVSPHFLFNTFNNLYVLTKINPAIAAETILGFSELMRYQLCECDGEKVNLEKEIKYIRNFLSLEKLRKDKLDIRIDYDKNDVSGVEIEPLLFVTLIENAVKHGSQQMENAFIHVRFERKGNIFSIEVVNSKPEVSTLGKESSLKKGIENLKNRLDLSYPSLYKLNLVDLKNKYLAKLEITLT